MDARMRSEGFEIIESPLEAERISLAFSQATAPGRLRQGLQPTEKRGRGWVRPRTLTMFWCLRCQAWEQTLLIQNAFYTVNLDEHCNNQCRYHGGPGLTRFIEEPSLSWLICETGVKKICLPEALQKMRWLWKRTVAIHSKNSEVSVVIIVIVILSLWWKSP